VDYDIKPNLFTKNPWDERGVCDERAYYQTSGGLLRASRDVILPSDWRKLRGLGLRWNSVESMAQAGVASYFAPPTAVIIDGYGLTDTFIAHLPAAKGATWRAGHYPREIPAGYVESIKQGRNLVAKRGPAWLYDRVRLVVSGPIWSWERWQEIVRLNLGLEEAETVVWHPSKAARPPVRADASPK
jgi:arabinofuranosyltransferase